MNGWRVYYILSLRSVHFKREYNTPCSIIIRRSIAKTFQENVFILAGARRDATRQTVHKSRVKTFATHFLRDRLPN